ncbi:cucumisin-like [Impatiens glandulifera]|uniref:cucumisin-like n=1 Tax=Impatiens glandulifera TaxID=253017 RepID=UPI001FB1104A|nr:cucumisin-like [Impatiens glandulifera]
MKKWEDKKRRHLEFRGNRVVVKLLLHQERRFSKVHKGSLRRYEGPFLEKKRVGKLAYHSKLPSHLETSFRSTKRMRRGRRRNESKSSPKLIYSYKNNLYAFVALLTNDEVQKILLMKGVISVFPNKINHILTTRSWDFIGFPQTVKRQNMVESDIIIGVLDTGIWPESNSFIDEGFGPPPSKWKGSCEGLTNFTCNNKIIGARYYNKDKDFKKDDIESPRDTDGHGTHVASIIAGGLVSTSFYGLSNGTAHGGVPSCRIAVYKVCWSSGCLSSDIMTAFDDAINDGVDIISYSLGQDIVSNYFNNVLYIGSFHAMTKGILTTMAGGNDGPGMGTIGNISPWALTVASSRTNRKFITNLKLGDGTTLEGISVNTFDPKGFPPIVHAANVKRRGFWVSSFR